MVNPRANWDVFFRPLQKPQRFLIYGCMTGPQIKWLETTGKSHPDLCGREFWQASLTEIQSGCWLGEEGALPPCSLMCLFPGLISPQGLFSGFPLVLAPGFPQGE